MKGEPHTSSSRGLRAGEAIAGMNTGGGRVSGGGQGRCPAPVTRVQLPLGAFPHSPSYLKTCPLPNPHLPVHLEDLSTLHPDGNEN